MSKKLIFRILSSIILISPLLNSAQNFSSNLEKEVFSAFEKDSVNYNFTEALFAIDSLVTKAEAETRKDELLSTINTLPKKETSDKKEKKRVNKIYNTIHYTFLKKYNLDSYFSDIFKDGTYNCVTASALYAFVFDQLDIPYHVKETPSHVFLIAYPNTHNIYLETTVPGAYGFSIPKEPEIKKIVDELIAYKLVTTEEVQAKGYAKFYEDYYYGKAYVDKSALIGMQYYNKSLSYLDNENYALALVHLNKAKVFFSSPLIKPLIKSILFLQINDLEFNTEKDIDFLVELLSISNYPKDYSLSNLRTSLFKIIEHDDNDAAFVELAISKFETVNPAKVKHEAIEFLYEYLAKNASRNGDNAAALNYADAILKTNPKSKIAKEVVEYFTFRQVGLSVLDLNALNTFLETCDKYPFLKTNKRYTLSLALFYGNIALVNFKSKNIKTGHSYLEQFETVMDDNSIINDMNKVLIADLYQRAGNYYYYKNRYAEAYKKYSKGLSYIPNHPELLKRAKWAKDEL